MNSANIKNVFTPRMSWLWLAAFVCALFPLGDYQMEFFAVTVTLMFTWSFVMLSRALQKGWMVPRSAVLLIAGLFWILVVASFIWSEVKSISLIGLCFFSVFPLGFFTFVLTGDTPAYKKIACALAVVFAVLAVWAVVQFFFLNAYFMGQARDPLADPSSLGALFSLAFFCSIGWVMADRPRREHKFAVALAILLLCGIMATVARGPVFAALPALVLFAVLLWPKVKERRKSLLIILLGGLAFYGVMQTGVQKKLDIGNRIFGTVTLQGDVSNNRINIWKATADIIQDHPWLGTGIGTFFLYYPEYRLPGDISGTFLVHNDPLQFWVELGILGPILFYGFMLAACIRSFRALNKKDGASGTDRILIVSILCALAAMVVHSHVAFNHYNLPAHKASSAVQC